MTEYDIYDIKEKTITREEFEQKRNANVTVERYHGNTYKLKRLGFGGPNEYIVLWYRKHCAEPDRHYLGTFNTEADALEALHKFQKSHRNNDYKKRHIKRNTEQTNEKLANELADSLATYYEDYNIRYCSSDNWKDDDLIHAMCQALAESDATSEYPLGFVQRIAKALQRRNVTIDESLMQALARDFAEFIIGGDSNE